MNWEDWEIHYKSLGIDPLRICKDGVFDDSNWADSNTRILFIMKEVNDWKGGDLKSLFSDGPKHQMWHTIARWSAGILNAFPPFDSIDNDKSLRESIKQIASINLKKTSGGSSSNMSQINAYAHQDKELLRKQISEINPTHIIAAGTFDILIWLLDLNIEVDSPKEKPVFKKELNSWVIPWRHPSRVNNRETYSQLKNLLKGTM